MTGTFLTNGFQFLLVRLRVPRTPTNENILGLFQFLLVRLRGISNLMVGYNDRLFQFLLVRLRVRIGTFKS